MRALPADARLLDSAEGSDLVEHETVIYTDHATFECLHDPESAIDVRRVKVRRQTCPRVICESDGLVLVFELQHTRDGSQDLVPAHVHLRTHARENGRLEE